MKKITRLRISTFTLIATSAAILMLCFLIVPVSAEQNQNSDREERLYKMEQQIEYFLKQGGIDKEQLERQKNLTDLQNTLEETALKLAGTEILISSSQIEIIGMIAIIVGILSGLGIVVVKLYAENHFNKIINEAEKELHGQIETLSLDVQTAFYSELSYAGWGIYQPLLEKLKESDFDPNRSDFLQALIQIRIAMFFANKGLSLLEEKKAEVKNRFLLNDYIYHATMELSLPKKFKAPIKVDQDISYPILSRAKECLKKSKEQEGKDIWYNLQESAAFTMLMIGNDQEQADGKELIENLLSDQTKLPDGGGFSPPSLGWREKTYQRWVILFEINLSVPSPATAKRS